MDQVLVQRVFAAKNLNEGRLGATFCAFLKTLNPIILVGPGLIAAALYPGLASGDLAYPTLLKNLMPTGLLGLTIAGITAALMGHLSATYNSVGTLITRDFYLKIKPDADQDRQILVGRISVLSVFVLGALWAPVIGQSKSMFIYLQNVQAYLMIPFAGIFLFAVFWRRTNAPGVLACMLAALVLCPTMMLNNQKHFLPFMNHPLLKPWLHGALIVGLLCMLVLVVVSLLTPAPAPEKLKNTTVHSLWGTDAQAMAEDEMMAPETCWYRDYRLWLTIVSTGTAVAWYIMR
jgi:SSS family solute:Na+ symporter